MRRYRQKAIPNTNNITPIITPILPDEEREDEGLDDPLLLSLLLVVEGVMVGGKSIKILVAIELASIVPMASDCKRVVNSQGKFEPTGVMILVIKSVSNAETLETEGTVTVNVTATAGILVLVK